MKFPLSQSIQAHGGEVSELSLREPTGEDVRACKALPYVVGADESVNIQTEVAAKYIARCAGIPLGSVDQISVGDLNNLFWWVAGFFLGRGAKQPTS